MEKTVLSAETILKERYRIIQLLGHGGMGAVYEAMDKNLRCKITIKETFATEAQSDVRKAFAKEAQLLANIRHPAIPKVSDYFEQGDGLFFVMEFIPGLNLEEKLKVRGSPFPVQDVLEWADALLAALSELHSIDPPIVHRDIKPSNLKLSPKGEIFLLDFGLAKGALGQMSTVLGQNYSNLQGHTPYFSPPEQIARTGTTPRSDLYSLAATLWCLLTYTLPPDAMLRLKDINDGLPDPVRPASDLNLEVPLAVSDILTQAMSLNMTNRPASAAEMREALREAVEAPLRAQAERARHEEEENIRREAEDAGRLAAEEEWEQRLEKESARFDAELLRLDERYTALEEKYISQLERAHEELEKTQEALSQARDAISINQMKSHQFKERLDAEEKTSVAEKELRVKAEAKLRRTSAALEEMTQKVGLLTDQRDEALKLVSQSESLLQEKTLALQRAERERDKALRAASDACRQLDIADRQLAAFRRPEPSFTKRFALAWSAQSLDLREALLYAGIVVLLALIPFAVILKVGPFSRPSLAVSDNKLKVTIGDIELEMVKIPGGSFMMGSPDAGRGTEEKPQHKVTVPEFDIGKYEVTQAQWRMVARLPKAEIDLNESPSHFTGHDLPVEDVSWDEAVEFCARLSKATGLKYRLPTEAEWEYAARGGQASAPAPAADVVLPGLDEMAWTADNSGKQPFDSLRVWGVVNNNLSDFRAKVIDNSGQTHPVGRKFVNGFGLYDTLGNVWEWCSDNWHPDYKGASGDGTGWTDGGDPNLRVCRGGSWLDDPWWATPTSRSSAKHDGHFAQTGFRIVRAP